MGATVTSPSPKPLKFSGNVGIILGLYRDNGKENGSYYLGFRALGL